MNTSPASSPPPSGFSSTTLSVRQRALFAQLLDSFLENGFHSFTIDTATKEFHCSKSTLYALGSSRDDIVRRVLISFFREVARRTTAALKTSKSPKAALENYFSAIAAALEPASAAFVHDLATDDVAIDIYTTNTNAATSVISALIEQGIRSGEFHTPAPSFLAAIVTSSMQQIQQGAFEGVISTPQAYQELGKLLLARLCTPE